MLKLIRRDPLFMKGYKEYYQEFYDHNILWFKPKNPDRIDDNWFERTFDWYNKKEHGIVQRITEKFSLLGCRR